MQLNLRRAKVRWFDSEKTTIGIDIMVLSGCESDGPWLHARLRGALPHAVFDDPFRVWIPAHINNKFTFLIYIHA